MVCCLSPVRSHLNASEELFQSVKYGSASEPVDTDRALYSVLVDFEKLGPTLMIPYGPCRRAQSL